MDAIQNPPTRSNIRKYKRFRDCVHGDGDNFCAFPCCRFDAKHHVLANVGVILEGRVGRPKWHPESSKSPEQHELPVFRDDPAMIDSQSSLRVVVAWRQNTTNCKCFGGFGGFGCREGTDYGCH